MISKIDKKSVNFKGTLEPNAILKGALDYTKSKVSNTDGCEYKRAENIADTINYILEETPKKDEFVLIYNSKTTDVELLENNKRVARGPVNSLFQDINEISMMSANVLAGYSRIKGLETHKTETIEKMERIKKRKSKVERTYLNKKQKLEEEYKKQLEKLNEDTQRKQDALRREYKNLEKQRAKEALSSLKKAANKVGFDL